MLQNQRFLTVPLADKVNVAYSFVKSHAKSKIILFVSSCKQARARAGRGGERRVPDPAASTLAAH